MVVRRPCGSSVAWQSLEIVQSSARGFRLVASGAKLPIKLHSAAERLSTPCVQHRRHHGYILRMFRLFSLKLLKMLGWGTWIRTKTNRVRVCCATVTPFPIAPEPGIDAG